ncbi:MAG: HEAT repeat domain-containing protein [Sedimentisphaerales bacterium]|nr:HEAT repeat domain-containing protein [Sedimentisphaerales bacterium]
MRRRYITLTLTVGIVFFNLTICHAAQTYSKGDVDRLVEQLNNYEYQNDPATIRSIEGIIRYGSTEPQMIAYMEEQLLKLLQSEQATLSAKRFACHQLWIIGSERSIPVLGDMLKRPETCEMACYALRSNPSPQTDAVLRDVLPLVDPEDKIRIINLLGERRNRDNFPFLIELARGKDAKLGQAAVVALGKLGTIPAAQFLKEARGKAKADIKDQITQSYLQCAQRLLLQSQKKEAVAIYKELLAPNEPIWVRQAGVMGMLQSGGESIPEEIIQVIRGDNARLRAAAISGLHLMPGRLVTLQMLTGLESLSSGDQALLIEALTVREPKLVRTSIAKKTESSDSSVRVAALTALGKVGDVSSVPVLIKALSGTEGDRQVALVSLRQLKGDSINSVILTEMQAAQNQTKADLIEILSDRQATEAVDAILKAAEEGNAIVQKAAYKALARLAEEDKLKDILQVFLWNYNAETATEAERMIIAIAKKGDVSENSKLVQTASVAMNLPEETRKPVCLSLLRVLGGIGSEKALEFLTMLCWNPDVEIRDTAIRELSQWSDPVALPKLFELMDKTDEETTRILALRGYLRLLQVPSDRSCSDTVTMMISVRKYVTRLQDQRLVLSVLSTLNCMEALDMAAGFLDNAAVAQEAALASVRIADALTEAEYKSRVKAVMQKVLTVVQSGELAKQAEAILKRAGT